MKQRDDILLEWAKTKDDERIAKRAINSVKRNTSLMPIDIVIAILCVGLGGEDKKEELYNYLDEYYQDEFLLDLAGVE